MKKGLVLILAAVIVLILAVCIISFGNKKPEAEPTAGNEYAAGDLAAALEEITEDFDTVTQLLTQKLEETFASVGTTFEEYQKNKALVDDWIEQVLSEADALFVGTREKSIAYFKRIAADPEHGSREFCNEALSAYYGTVYNEAMGGFYKALYDEAMGDLYTQYYNGIIKDAYDELPYSQWSKASSECYKTWSDAHSKIYKKWAEERSYIYGLWSAVNSAFCWHNNFDVDAIIADYERKNTDETQGTVPTETPTEAPTEGDPTEEIDPAFKAAMDSYEKFFNEYVAIVKKYKDNPTDMSILSDYAAYMGQYADMVQKMEKWENEDLNAAEVAYYIDVQARISKKLLEIAK